MVKLHRQTPHKPTGAIRVSALPAPLAKGLKNQAHYLTHGDDGRRVSDTSTLRSLHRHSKLQSDNHIWLSTH